MDADMRELLLELRDMLFYRRFEEVSEEEAAGHSLVRLKIGLNHMSEGSGHTLTFVLRDPRTNRLDRRIWSNSAGYGGEQLVAIANDYIADLFSHKVDPSAPPLREPERFKLIFRSRGDRDTD